MVDESFKRWAIGFDDLQDKLDEVIYVQENVGFDAVDIGPPPNRPGLVIRFNLPDGRVALAGMDLLEAVTMLNGQAAELGYHLIGMIDLGEGGADAGLGMGVNPN